MKILQQVNYLGGLGADRWIVGGYHDAFLDLGHEHFFLTASDDFASALQNIKPNILMVGADKLNRENLPALLQARAQGTKVFVWVDSMFAENKEFLKAVLQSGPADVYHGETEPEWMKHFTELTGQAYFLTPNAANRKYHFPVRPVKKYECDIAYLGANLPLKQDAFRRLLFPLKKRYKVRIYGPGWTIKDNALRILAKLGRDIGWWKLNEALSRARLTVPPAEENQLHSSAKVSLNVHEMRHGRMVSHVILNERTFKIPACGGFEICDYIPKNILRQYFIEAEMVMAETDDDWFRKIDYYLTHEAERKRIRETGTKRALTDHTYHNRVQRILEIYKSLGQR